VEIRDINLPGPVADSSKPSGAIILSGESYHGNLLRIIILGQKCRRKVKVLGEVSQGGRTIAGPPWTVTETITVILVVDTRY
jgi:hypothetical protein